MKRIVLTTAVTATAIAAIIIGCASDIILPEDPTLKGLYKGKYTVFKNAGQQNEQQFSQDINWTFEDQNFNMKIDTGSVTYGSHCFCQPAGQYVLADKVRLRVVSGANIPSGGPCTACNSDENPEGDFTLIRTGDTLNLIQIDGADRKELKLVPAN